MQEGALMYLQWYRASLMHGIINLQENKDRVTELTSRLVDYHLGNIARELRIVLEKDLSEEKNIVLFQYLLNDIALYAQGLLNYEKFKGQLQWDVLRKGGLNLQSKDLQEVGIKFNEKFYVLHNEYFSEEKIHASKTWFYFNQRFYYHIEYVFNTRVESNFKVGYQYCIDGYIYPSTAQERISINDSSILNKVILELNGIPLSVIEKQLRTHYNVQPFIRRIPFILLCDSICRIDGRQYAVEKAMAIPISTDSGLSERIKGMKNVTLFGYWYGLSFTPLSIIVEDCIIPIELI